MERWKMTFKTSSSRSWFRPPSQPATPKSYAPMPRTTPLYSRRTSRTTSGHWSMSYAICATPFTTSGSIPMTI